MINAFGATEMLHAFIATNDALGDLPGSMGRPVPGYRVAVLDASGNPVLPGEVGRLAAIGPTGCRYLRGENQTEHVHNGWNVFSDLVRQEDDGTLWYEGRADNVIITAGYNVSAHEVEWALSQSDAVVECAVVGRHDDARGMIVHAFVVLRGRYVASEEMKQELRSFVKTRIAPHKAPRSIEFRDALPRNAHGKIAYARLFDAVRLSGPVAKTPARRSPEPAL